MAIFERRELFEVVEARLNPPKSAIDDGVCTSDEGSSAGTVDGSRGELLPVGPFFAILVALVNRTARGGANPMGGPSSGDMRG